MHTGMNTFSSKLPWEAARPTATSLPITCTATMVTASHWVGLTLAGHDGGAGLVLRDLDLPQAAPGAGGQPAHVVGDFHQIRRQGLERPVGEHQLVLTGEGVELVGGRDKGLTRQLRYRLGHGRVKALGGVEPGAHGGPAQASSRRPGSASSTIALSFSRLVRQPLISWAR